MPKEVIYIYISFVIFGLSRAGTLIQRTMTEELLITTQYLSGLVALIYIFSIAHLKKPDIKSYYLILVLGFAVPGIQLFRLIEVVLKYFGEIETISFVFSIACIIPLLVSLLVLKPNIKEYYKVGSNNT